MLEGGIKYAVTDPVLREKKRRSGIAAPMWPIVSPADRRCLPAIVYAVRWNRRRNA